MSAYLVSAYLNKVIKPKAKAKADAPVFPALVWWLLALEEADMNLGPIYLWSSVPISLESHLGRPRRTQQASLHSSCSVCVCVWGGICACLAGFCKGTAEDVAAESPEKTPDSQCKRQRTSGPGAVRSPHSSLPPSCVQAFGLVFETGFLFT